MSPSLLAFSIDICCPTARAAASTSLASLLASGSGWLGLTRTAMSFALGTMCGRRRLGKNFLSCCSIGRVRSCVRPVLCGGEAAGHNALRGSGPNQKHAFKDALTQTGSPDPRIDLVCITSSCPRQFLQTSNAVVVSWPHLLESLWL